MNYQLKKHIDSKAASLELDIPYLGTVIAKGGDLLDFAVAQYLNDESGGGLISAKLETSKKGIR